MPTLTTDHAPPHSATAPACSTAGWSLSWRLWSSAVTMRFWSWIARSPAARAASIIGGFASHAASSTADESRLGSGRMSPAASAARTAS